MHDGRNPSRGGEARAPAVQPAKDTGGSEPAMGAKARATAHRGAGSKPKLDERAAIGLGRVGPARTERAPAEPGESLGLPARRRFRV